jgi:hypothetical protein
MTVQELINALSAFPPTADVLVDDGMQGGLVGIMPPVLNQDLSGDWVSLTPIIEDNDDPLGDWHGRNE